MDHERTPPAPVRRLARQLLSAGDELSSDPAGLSAAFERACEALHSDLGPLITSRAFHAAQSRALHLATVEFGVLGRVTRESLSRCSLEALRDELPADHRRQLGPAVAALLAHLLWILIMLIGKRLTLRALTTARPDLAIEDDLATAEGQRDE